jgi:hypothetical protein
MFNIKTPIVIAFNRATRRGKYKLLKIQILAILIIITTFDICCDVKDLKQSDNNDTRPRVNNTNDIIIKIPVDLK